MRLEILSARKQIAEILEDYLHDRINNDQAVDAILAVDCGDDKELNNVSCGLALTFDDPFRTYVHSKSPRGMAKAGHYFSRMIAFLRSDLPYPTRRRAPLGPIENLIRLLKWLLRCLSLGIYPRDVQEAENAEDYWPFSSFEEMHFHMSGRTMPDVEVPER